jgi:SAM-dependent methyltransferase
MSEPSPRFWELFFEIYEPLPRQGPGNRACAAQALGLCRELPSSPVVLDLGCGVGGQTLHLAELLPAAVITALDSHAPSIERLRATATERGLAHDAVSCMASRADLATTIAAVFERTAPGGHELLLGPRPRPGDGACQERAHASHTIRGAFC